jgi:hypothetical protein
LRPPSPSLVVPVILGCSLRLYELVALEDASLGEGLPSLLWTSLPFAVALLMGLAKRLHFASVGYASACLLALLYSHYVLFIAPSPDSSAVLIVFFPVWCLLIFGPLGAVLGWAIGRRLKRSAA